MQLWQIFWNLRVIKLSWSQLEGFRLNKKSIFTISVRYVPTLPLCTSNNNIDIYNVIIFKPGQGKYQYIVLYGMYRQ